MHGDLLSLIDSTGNAHVGQAPQDGVLLLSVLNRGTPANGWVSFRIDDAPGPFTLELTTPDVAGTAPATVPISVP